MKTRLKGTMKGQITAIALLALFAGSAVAGNEPENKEPAEMTADPARTLLAAASADAARDAAESLLVDTRKELEIRFNGHKSDPVVKGP